MTETHMTKETLTPTCSYGQHVFQGIQRRVSVHLEHEILFICSDTSQFALVSVAPYTDSEEENLLHLSTECFIQGFAEVLGLSIC